MTISCSWASAASAVVDPVDVRLLDGRVGAFAAVQQGVAAEGDDDAHGSVLQGGDEYGLDGVQSVLRLSSLRQERPRRSTVMVKPPCCARGYGESVCA
jgi:hypothetical protein